MLTKAISGIKNTASGNMQENSKKYCFIVDAGCTPRCSSIHYGIQDLQDQGYDFSFIYSPGNSNASNYSSISSNNSCYQFKPMSGRMAFSEYVFDHIFDKSIKIISAAGLTELPEDFGEISTTSKQDYDNDGLLDVQEIYFNVKDKNGNLLVTINNDGSIELPSFNKCVSVGGTYVEQGLKRFYDEADESILSQLDEIKVLPILADPTSEDGDGDGILDLTEFEIMQKVRGDVRLFSENNSGTLESSESGNTDEKINPTQTDTLVSLHFNSITKSDIFTNGTNISKAYTLATEKKALLKFETDNNDNSTKQEKSVNYGVLGTDKDAFYLEAFSSFNEDGKVVNELRINANIEFNKEDFASEIELISFDKNGNVSKTGKKINKDNIISAIEDKWGGTYDGSKYDFYEGMSIDVSVHIIECEVDINKEGYRYINKNKNDKLRLNHQNNFAKLDFIEYDETNPSKTQSLPGVNATLTGKPHIRLYSVQYYDGTTTPLDANQILANSAHEFGHVLGLKDAYGLNCEGNYYVEPVSFGDGTITNPIENTYEINYNSDGKLGDVNSGEMMHKHGRVSTNDIEMVIWARKTNKFQFFVPIGKTTNDNKTTLHGLSPAIKSHLFYRACNSVDKIGVIKDQYYYFNGKKYVPVTFNTTVTDFTDLDEEHYRGTEEYAMYEQYLNSIKPKEEGT